MKNKTCENCSVSYEPTSSSQKFCSAECRDKFAKRNRPIRHCVACGVDITDKQSTAKVCSNLCWNAHNRSFKSDGVEGVDHITCPVCNAKMRQLSHTHAIMHGFASIKQMQQHMNMTTTVCESKKQRSQGANNPAYQHGGKYSPWSKKFVRGYDAERHQQKNQQQSELRKQKPHLFKNCIEYWLEQANGDHELAKQMHLQYQRRDLKYFVDKYGEQEGKQRHSQKIQRWQDTLQSKPLEEQLEINKRKVKKSGCFFSKAEKELFEELKTHFSRLEDQFALCRNADSKKKKFFLYDMKLDNKIIEYNGDFWHSNPEMYNQNFVNPYTQKTQQEIHHKDAEKINLAKQHGFDVLVIWENKYQTNKKEVIEQCLEFLKK